MMESILELANLKVPHKSFSISKSEKSILLLPLATPLHPPFVVAATPLSPNPFFPPLLSATVIQFADLGGEKALPPISLFYCSMEYFGRGLDKY